MGLPTEKCQVGPQDPRTQVSIKLPYRPNLTAWPPGPDVGLGYTPTGRLQGLAHDPAPLLLAARPRPGAPRPGGRAPRPHRRPHLARSLIVTRRDPGGREKTAAGRPQVGGLCVVG